MLRHHNLVLIFWCMSVVVDSIVDVTLRNSQTYSTRVQITPTPTLFHCKDFAVHLPDIP